MLDHRATRTRAGGLQDITRGRRNAGVPDVLLAWGALAVWFPVAIVTRSPGCELGALPWLLAGRERWAAPRRGCAVGLDRLDAWEASRQK
jgi:hypothetical protein